MKVMLKTAVFAFTALSLINCAPQKMNATDAVSEGSVVETASGDIVTLPLEQALQEKAPSNNLPLEINDLPSELITLLTPPIETPVSNTSTGGFLSGLLGGSGGGFLSGLLGGGSNSSGGSSCGVLSSILNIGATFLSGSNPILGMIVPQLANSLLKCGSASPLTGLIPSGASEKNQIFALLSQIMQAKNQGKDPFALLNGLKNTKDLSSLVSIIGTLTQQSGGHQDLQSILSLIQNFQNNYGSAVGQCGTMNAMACQVFQIVNQVRSQKGLKALLPNTNCSLAAQAHSKDMYENSLFSYASSTGLSSKSRLAQYGLKTAAENIVRGEQLTAQKAVEMWMSSQSHMQKILSAEFTSGGVGFLNGYFTQCFTK